MKPDIKKIVVYGCGAAGANLLLNLITAYPDLEFAVVDFDLVESRNITPGTQPYSRSDLRRPKVQALQRIAREREKKIEAINTKITSTEQLRGYGSSCLLIDCFDNVPSRNLFHKVKGNILHVGFSASLTGETCWAESWTPMKESKADNAIDVCELHLARPFIQALTAISALLISEFLETGTKRNAYFDSKVNLKVF